MTTSTTKDDRDRVDLLMSGLLAQTQVPAKTRKPARKAASLAKVVPVAEAAPIAPAAPARAIADDYNTEAAEMLFVAYEF